MTRIIKFRAWNLKSMIFSETYSSLSRFFQKLESIEGENYRLMQFTGLLDSKGREIYEEDIVGMPAAGISKVGAIFGHHYSWADKVVWNENTASFQISQRMDGQYGLTTYLPPYNGLCFEIIGNIYENPTLLNQ